MKTKRIIYWIATGLLCLLMLGSAGYYCYAHVEVAKLFSALGYPVYLIYPLAIAKVLGVAAILTKKSKTLKEWAYAGFFFDFLLAIAAHVSVGDGQFAPAAVALTLLMISYILDRKIYG